MAWEGKQSPRSSVYSSEQTIGASILYTFIYFDLLQYMHCAQIYRHILLILCNKCCLFITLSLVDLNLVTKSLSPSLSIKLVYHVVFSELINRISKTKMIFH